MGKPPFDFNQRNAFRLPDVHGETHAAFPRTDALDSTVNSSEGNSQAGQLPQSRQGNDRRITTRKPVRQLSSDPTRITFTNGTATEVLFWRWDLE